jgi:hypothetical protein
MPAATIDRNERARLMVRAEAYDRRTKTPGSHGGVLKRTGLAVFKALLFGFHNVATGRCDPGYDALARLAGVARSTVAVALRRLEAAGLITRTRRQVGPVRLTNVYAFPPDREGAIPADTGATGGGTGGAGASKAAWSESRPETTKESTKTNFARVGPPGDRVRALLDALERRERRLGLAPMTGW